MKLLFEPGGVHIDSTAPGKPLMRSQKLALWSAEPVLLLTLDDRRKVALWGDVYYVIGRTGAISLLDTPAATGMLEGVFRESPLEEALSRIEGRYVGALIEDDETVTIFGDSLNSQEVFIAETDGRLHVSTDLADVVEHAGSGSYDQPSLAALMTIYGYYAPKRHTIYSNVQRLGVGDRLRVGPTGWKRETARYRPQPMRDYADRELEEYTQLFLDAVRSRSSADGNWVLLSSGWDSTSILAMLVYLHGPARVRAVIGRMDYSNRVDNINRFEIERASKVADYFGVPIEVTPFNLRDDSAIDTWTRIASVFRAHHLYALNAFNGVSLARAVAESGSGWPVFSGENSDGLHNFGFAQFATMFHRDLAFREYADKMACYLFGPTFFKAVEAGKHREDEIYRLFKMLNAGVEFRDDVEDPQLRRQYFLTPFFAASPRIPFAKLGGPALTKRGVQELESFIVDDYLRECLESVTPDTLYSWYLHMYASFHWQSSTTQTAMLALTTEGQSARLPFADRRLIDFCSAMPEYWGRGLNLNNTKYPLKWMLSNKIDYPMHLQAGPHSYLYDIDPSFSHAGEILYGSALKRHFQELLKSKPYHAVLSEDYFDLRYLDSVVNEYLHGPELVGQRRNDLTALVTLCLTGWYERRFAGVTSV